MAVKQITSKEYFRTLSIIYLALIGGQILIGVTFYYLQMTTVESGTPMILTGGYKYLIPAVIILAYFGGNSLYKNILIRLSKIDRLEDKMSRYRSAFLVRIAILEAAFILAVVVYANTRQQTNLYFAILPLAYAITLFPSARNVGRDLGLEAGDQRKIETPNEIIAEYQTGR